MGGGQLFVLRRANYLKSKGYEVHIVVTYHTNYFPLKDGFNNIPVYVVPEMGKPSVLYSKNKVRSIISGILEKIGAFSDLLIETHTLVTIEWGELIACQCKAKHLAYPLSENRVSKYYFNPGKKIFMQKLCSNSFYGCTSTSLKQIFGRENVPMNYVNIGYDESEFVANCVPELGYHRDEGDYIVTTITRLDKTYVEWLADAVAEMARKYKEQHFVLLIAGGSPHQDRVDYLKDNYNTATYCLANLNIVYLGYIEKLGKDIFEMSNVFVGMGTASINAISQRCISINIDPCNGMKNASGFFGIDTNNFAYSENGKLYSIFEKLEEAFLMSDEEVERTKQASRELYEKEYKTETCFEKLDHIYDNIEKSQDSDNYEISYLYRLLVQTATGLKHILDSSRGCFKK